MEFAKVRLSAFRNEPDRTETKTHPTQPTTMKRNIILTSLLLSSLPIMAGQPAKTISEPAPAQPDWEFLASLYLWGAGMDGTTGVKGIDLQVDVSFADIVSKLDLGLMGTFEVRKGRWGVIADLMYSELSGDGSTPATRVRGEIEMKQFLGSFYLGYRVVDTSRATIDLLAGTRVNWLDVDLSLSGAGGAFVNTSASKGWADAVGGFRARFHIGGPWYFQANGDIGGGSSDLTWQALGIFGYKVSERCMVGAGYRALGTDYTDGGFKYDLVSHGPILGLQWKF